MGFLLVGEKEIQKSLLGRTLAIAMLACAFEFFLSRRGCYRLRLAVGACGE